MGGRGPDVFLMETVRVTDFNLFPNLAKAMRNGAFYDVGESLAANDVLPGDFWPGLMEAGQYEGGQYLLPLSFRIPAALCRADSLAAGRFDETAAAKDTAAFFAEAGHAAAQSAGQIIFDMDLLSNMALPVLDYDTGRVNLSRPEVLAMLELERDLTLRYGQWNMAELDAAASPVLAAQMAEGSPFMLVLGAGSFPVELGWKLAAAGVTPALLAVPNETGGVTAEIGNYGMVDANTPHPAETAMLLAWLLSGDCQSAGEYPNGLISFPVRRGCTVRALRAIQESYKNPPWVREAPPEKAAEVAEHQAYYGEPLPPQTIRQLEAAFERINTVYFHSPWDGSSVQLGDDEHGDPLMTATKLRWIYGEITLEELLDTLEPRLPSRTSPCRWVVLPPPLSRASGCDDPVKDLLWPPTTNRSKSGKSFESFRPPRIRRRPRRIPAGPPDILWDG